MYVIEDGMQTMNTHRQLSLSLALMVLPVALILLQIDSCSAFTIPGRVRQSIMNMNPNPCTKFGFTFDKPSARSSSSLMLAKKKRRRRKSEGEDSDLSPPSSSSTSDLPDFDLDDDKLEKNAASIPSDEPSTSEISSAMMGSANKPVRSVDQLIADRSLEKNFEFDEVEDSSLPDLAVMAQQNSEMGRKRSKREARVAAALERKAEEETSNPLAQIPFILDEKGEVSAIKVRRYNAILKIFHGLIILHTSLIPTLSCRIS